MPNGDPAANSSLGRMLGAGAITVLLSIGGSIAAASYYTGGVDKQVEVNTKELEHRRTIFDLIPKLDLRTEVIQKDIDNIKKDLRELRQKIDVK